MPEVGLEPTRPCGQRILNPSRLPFRHSGRYTEDYVRTACFASTGLAAAAGRRPLGAGARGASCEDMWLERNSNKKAARVAARPLAGGLGCVRFAGVGRCCPRWLRCFARRPYHDAG